MRVPILAWGALIWDRRSLNFVDDFLLRGALLPVKLCRVSGGGRLTLVVNEAVGASCPTSVAESAYGELDAALENLWIREGSQDVVLPKNVRTHARVGFVEVALGSSSAKPMERYPKAVAAIKTWTQANGFDAAKWTDLARYYTGIGQAGEWFSVEAAIRYLEMLDAPKLSASLGNIRSAPAEVQAPIRSAVNASWFEG